MKTIIQNLKSRMQEQSFCILYCSVFLLQNPFQIFCEINHHSKFSAKHNYKIKYCYNFTNNNFTNNSILDYLCMLQTGAKVGNDEYG